MQLEVEVIFISSNKGAAQVPKKKYFLHSISL